MKIAIFEAEQWERSAFEELPKQCHTVLEEGPLDETTAKDHADAEVISTFIYSDLGRGTLERFENLRLIAARSTGTDHIDKDYCQEKDIEIRNVPSYGENTVAEHVFGLILTISHQIWEAVDRTRKGEFDFEGLQGFDLKGKTLGVIGTGSIGEHAIRIAKGFGMEVVAHDVQQRPELADELSFRYLDLNDLLAESDVITIHVPGTEATEGLLSYDEFNRMKDEVVLINTSRGSVVDVKALTEALADGKVAAAGLDVLPDEPAVREEAELLRAAFRREHDLERLLADHLLLRLRNVYITPHSAFNTREAVQRILDTTVENISSFVQERSGQAAAS